MVQPLNANRQSVGLSLIAVDPHGTAGKGDIIYMVTGGDAIGVISGREMPVDVAIVGIVDSISAPRTEN